MRVSLSFLLVWSSSTFLTTNAFITKSSACRRTHSFVATARAATAAGSDDIYVMVNGMPGPMATAAAEACLRKGLKLSPIAMTGPDMVPCSIDVFDTVTQTKANVRLIPSSNVEEIESSLAGVKEAAGPKGLLAIDYRFYVKNDIPFVMGTTGGDRELLLADCEGHSCVIAPNMGKQIVAMQAALEDLATKYPAAFEGYKLHVRESHQVTKADTSGTAKAVIDSIKKLSADTDYTVDDVVLIRDEEAALQFGVTENAMKGHAFHTYTLTSPDGSVEFQLKHNVAGRTVYAEGTADAVKFLAKKLRTEDTGKIYTMVNVLEEGALE
jgi:4-hydroxy-tetrahydrodipicolinate reductase